MRILLHIGQSKTGTSALQAHLAASRERLAANGFLYPDARRAGLPLGMINHNPLAETLAGFPRYPHLSADAYFRQFFDEAARTNAHTMILSGESFFGAPQIWRLEDPSQFAEAHAAKIRRLASYLKGHAVEIALYLRAPEDWFESAVSQIIRYEGLLGRKVYESDEQLYERLRPHLDYESMTAQWRDILKAGSMHIIPYDRGALKGGDTAADFLDRFHIGIPPPAAETSEAHASLDRRYVALKRALNRVPKRKAEERAIIALLDRLNARLERPEKYRIDPGLKSRIRESCAAGLARLEICAPFPPPPPPEDPPRGPGESLDTERKKEREELLAALIAFDNDRNSSQTGLSALKERVAGILRDSAPGLYAALGYAKRKLRRS